MITQTTRSLSSPMSCLRGEYENAFSGLAEYLSLPDVTGRLLFVFLFKDREFQLPHRMPRIHNSSRGKVSESCRNVRCGERHPASLRPRPGIINKRKHIFDSQIENSRNTLNHLDITDDGGHESNARRNLSPLQGNRAAIPFQPRRRQVGNSGSNRRFRHHHLKERTILTDTRSQQYAAAATHLSQSTSTNI